MTAIAPDPAATSFSQMLRGATRVQHEQAEDSGFMRALTGGELDPQAYAALAGQLWFVYSALESAGRALRADDVVGPFVDPRLDRCPALEADLDHLLGAGWRGTREPLPATQAYADRVHEVARTWAPAYVAHHYTRYLGDLSGGQILARVLTRSYGMTEGLAFFTFVEIEKPKPYKDRYRALLDAVPLDPAGQERVVEEARLAFDLNTALFGALGAQYLPRTSSPGAA